MNMFYTVLHCFSLNRSPPPPCAVGFAAHAFSATSLQRCILLHMHRRRILQLGFELLYALVVQTALVQCTIILELGFELLYALVQCTIMLTPRVLHFAARLSVIYAFGRAALFVCPTCGDDDAFPTDCLRVLLKGL